MSATISKLQTDSGRAVSTRWGIQSRLEDRPQARGSASTTRIEPPCAREIVGCRVAYAIPEWRCR
eukprot:2266689-Rhodomonas_salina.3